MDDIVATVTPPPAAAASAPPPPAKSGVSAWLGAAWKGEIVPTRPSLPPRPTAPRSYLWIGLAIVALSVVILELVYARAPVPPGVDSGDWVQRSFAWVGLPHPPANAVGSPYLYSPLMFPFIGILELITGNPLTTGFVFGGALLAVFGLSVVHVARTYFVSGPTQVLFIGIAVLNGTTISILFWGGYPNFLGFVFFNETLVLLLWFLRSRTLRDGLLFYGAASLLYLTHSLTFAVFAATFGVVALVLLALDRRWFGVVLSRANLVGLAILSATVVGYIEITKFLQIPHPGYFNTNAAAYFVDNIGEFFRPLSSGPMVFPLGPGVTMSPIDAMAILVVAGLAVAVVTLLLGALRPAWIDHRHYIAAAAFFSVCLVPVGGYLVHVDTDYTRFVYFLPLPVALLVGLAVDGLMGAGRHPSATVAPTSAPDPPPPRARRPVSREGIALAAVGIILLLLVANVTVPTAVYNEQLDAGTSDHDAAFLQATDWLNANDKSGSVLTTSGAVRWVEALTDRGAFDVGPTWLLFEPWQIVNAEEAYWALNSLTVVTNNVQVLSFSGFNTSTLGQAPMYSAYIEGVQFPILRVLPYSIYASASSGDAYAQVPAWGLVTPQLTVPGPQPISGAIAYTTPLFTVQEVGAMGPPGSAWVNLTVTPSPGDKVAALNLTLASPPVGNGFLHPPTSAGASWTGSALSWNDVGTLGQYPGNYSIRSWVTPSPAPQGTPLISSGPLNNAEMTFANPAPSQPFTVSLLLSTDGTSNPAIVLPSVLNTTTYLAEHDIHYLLVPVQGGFGTTVAFYQAVFGYSVAFQNAQWTVLEG